MLDTMTMRAAEMQAGPETAGRVTPSLGAEILIVIPSLNEQAHIESVIRSLQADQGCSGALIVLADGGSRDETVAIVERIGSIDRRVVALRTDRPLGISASINRAVERFGAGRRWLVRIDAHAEYPADYTSRLVRAALQHGAASVVTPMQSRGCSRFQQAAASAQNSFLGTGGSAHRTMGGRSGWVEHGHHALMALETFASVGGYDESFSHNEDAELDHRILGAGGRIWLESELALVYYPRRTIRSLVRQYFKYGRGRAMTVARHPGRRRARQVAPLLIAPMCGLALLGPIFWAACVPALAWAILCLVYGLVLARRATPWGAASGVAAVLMQAAWSFGYWTQILLRRRPGSPPGALRLTDDRARG